MTDYRITPDADGKWYVEKYASYSYIRSLFGKREGVWQWFKVSEGFESVEEARRRIEFIKQAPVYVTVPDQPSNDGSTENR